MLLVSSTPNSCYNCFLNWPLCCLPLLHNLSLQLPTPPKLLPYPKTPSHVCDNPPLIHDFSCFHKMAAHHFRASRPTTTLSNSIPFLLLFPYFSNRFKYLFLTFPHSPLVIISMKYFHLNNHHPTTWGSCLQSPKHKLIRLPLEKLSPSWCSNILSFSPISPFHDVPKPPSHSYNHHHHFFFTPLHVPNI